MNANYFDNSYVRFSPVRRTAAAVDQLDENEPLRNQILGQEKLEAQFTLDASAGWSWKVNNKFKNIKHNIFLVFNLGVNNILNNQDFIVTGYEQLRFDYTGKNIRKFDKKIMYAYGINYFASISLRFN